MNTGAWFLFTARDYGRALAVQEQARHYGTGEPVVVIHDLDRRGLGPMMDLVYQRWKGLAWYGWLADDTFPCTYGWDKNLPEAAGDFGLSYAADGGYQDTDDLISGRSLSSGLVWGGELLRATDSWSLGFRDAYIDIAWLELVRPLRLHRYTPEVTVRHDQWRTGRREPDELDDDSAARVDHDLDRFQGWQRVQLDPLRNTLVERMNLVASPQ